ncbi:MAG TPA: hypothetical protein VGL72_33685 [Bryobacteraceae bacterium]|jgi:uncharacterized protein
MLSDALRILIFLPALLYGIDCASPENSAEQTICTHPDLRSADAEIEHQTAALKSKLSGENAAILTDTQMPFLRERDDCSNDSDVPACIHKVLAARSDLLNRAQSDPNVVREALAHVRYIDIGFLWKYWGQLVNRKLSVYGCILLDDATPRTHAVLETENQHSVPVVFKSMTEEIADFLDDQKPCAHWLVTIRKQAGKFELYSDDVLGRPLP